MTNTNIATPSASSFAIIITYYDDDMKWLVDSPPCTVQCTVCIRLLHYMLARLVLYIENPVIF